MATRIAQYSLYPPARPVQMSTSKSSQRGYWRVSVRISPLLCIAQAPRVLALHEVPLYLGGKPKQDRAIKISKLSYRTTWGQRTMTSGATTQFTTTLNKICTQISLFPSTLCKVSNLILQRIGYIITNNPTATHTSA